MKIAWIWRHLDIVRVTDSGGWRASSGTLGARKRDPFKKRHAIMNRNQACFCNTASEKQAA